MMKYLVFAIVTAVGLSGCGAKDAHERINVKTTTLVAPSHSVPYMEVVSEDGTVRWYKVNTNDLHRFRFSNGKANTVVSNDGWLVSVTADR